MAHELDRVRTAQARDNGVGVAHLRNERRVVRGHKRRPQLRLHPAARILEHPLKAAHLLVAVGKIVGDGR